MNNISYFFEATEQQSSNSNNGLDTIINFLKNLSDKLNGATVWLPIVITALIAIAFLLGFWFNYKWTIFKVVAIVITIVATILFYNLVSEQIANRLKDDDTTNTTVQSGLPFISTLVAIIIYLSIRVFFFFITLIIQLATKKKRKEKAALRKESGHRGNRIWTRVLFGGTNAILTIPGTLLIANVITTGIPTTNSTTKSTSLGVKMMTGGKGASLSGLGAGVIAGIDLFKKGNTLFELMQKDPSNLSKKDLDELTQALGATTNILNNEDVQNVIKEVATSYVKKEVQVINKTLNTDEYLDKLVQHVEETNSSYKLADDAQKKDILTSYAIEQINKKGDEFMGQAESASAKEYLNVARYVISSLNKDTRNSLATISASILNMDPNIESKINTEQVTKAIFNKLAEFKYQKEVIE
ncbi:EI24 domain-containing protein [Mycoplasmopsis verecunda]|uniref:Uncharacterized protein n=1 Tax=Mycoplasmopsis verecunda TaxID=171291 RepID=A0A1T4LTK0_9BACT|nr:CvpA family protein [Mycoplasmopsis verecunda]WPB54561.1 CvpA family protein [Mycoplasmopsis verecunda]SJZ58005.1 hypothetical protein SAMN02745154_00536 [Mycoplasmopsis verecunda]